MNRLMLNGSQLVSGEPTLKLQGPCNAHLSMQISSSTVTPPGYFTPVFLPLPLCIGNIINNVTIYYQNSNSRSCIIVSEFVEQTIPDTTIGSGGDTTHLTSTTPTSYSRQVNVVVNGNMSLLLFVNFANTADTIRIGAIEIDYN